MSGNKERIVNMNLGIKSAARLAEEAKEKMNTYIINANMFASYLGGQKLLAAVPGSSFQVSTSAPEPNLFVFLPREVAKNGIRKIVIFLTPKGLFNVSFYKCWMDKFTYREEQMSHYEDISDDSLLQVFKSETGLG